MVDPVPANALAALDKRSRDIFREIVESYLETGEPVGSRTLSKRGLLTLSPASIRNTMADLEALGLLDSPHAMAGRRPTQSGLRFLSIACWSSAISTTRNGATSTSACPRSISIWKTR